MLIQGVASSATNTLLEPPRVHSSFSFVQGRVCEECNTGWMSRLEAVAKPILLPLIDKQRTIESLSPEEGDIVGRWAAKTAYMHSWTSPLKRSVQLDHLTAMCGDGGHLVPGVGVCGAQLDYKQQSAYVLSGFWPQCCEVTEKRFEGTQQGWTAVPQLIPPDGVLARLQVSIDLGTGPPTSDLSTRARMAGLSSL